MDEKYSVCSLLLASCLTLSIYPADPDTMITSTLEYWAGIFIYLHHWKQTIIHQLPKKFSRTIFRDLKNYLAVRM